MSVEKEIDTLIVKFSLFIAIMLFADRHEYKVDFYIQVCLSSAPDSRDKVGHRQRDPGRRLL